MAKNISVLLLEDITSLGRAGSIVEVADAYARNFLFPQGKAALATASVKQEKEGKDVAKRKKAEEELLAQQETALRLDNTELLISARAHEAGELYGSIAPKMIADLLEKEAKVLVSAKKIAGQFPIKTTGSHDITVSLAQGVEFQMRIVVTPDSKSDQRKNDEE